MMEFLATVSHSGEMGDSSFREMKVLDHHMQVTPIEDLEEGDPIKYDSGFFRQHNQFTVQLRLQDMPRGDKSIPEIGENKVYRVTIEEVDYERQTKPYEDKRTQEDN